MKCFGKKSRFINLLKHEHSRKILYIEECGNTCGSKLDWIRGSVALMDCDLDGFYDYNLRCIWTISGEFYLAAKLHILDLDIQQATECIFDYLKVIQYNYIKQLLTMTLKKKPFIIDNPNLLKRYVII